MSGQTGDKSSSAGDGAGRGAEKEGECRYCGGSGRCQKCDGVLCYAINTICPACNGTGLCYCRLEPVKPPQ